MDQDEPATSPQNEKRKKSKASAGRSRAKIKREGLKLVPDDVDNNDVAEKTARRPYTSFMRTEAPIKTGNEGNAA
ncbi:hypothetical protein GWI33_005255 [Rhynchophorus ferrugineus]|uniref:Uncharacterized protein n=1 Tax=Rhynchophorus ferrugineus TaxID=354439 RepID=A0A834IN93_RHYFE|nr:hypothetical protein GWI33_005255 [Rhynchophorus ferrugineus]